MLALVFLPLLADGSPRKGSELMTLSLQNPPQAWSCHLPPPAVLRPEHLFFYKCRVSQTKSAEPS